MALRSLLDVPRCPLLTHLRATHLPPPALGDFIQIRVASTGGSKTYPQHTEPQSPKERILVGMILIFLLILLKLV